MRPAKTKIKKFRMEPKYVHHRSEGLTRRQNRATKLLVIEAAKERDCDDVPYEPAYDEPV